MIKKDNIDRIFGYKSFNVNKTNIHGIIFEEGKKYHINGQIKFGPSGNGYHFCERLEDTIRYSDYNSNSILRNVKIAEVVGSGTIVESFDNYNEYFDMFCASDLEIIRFLPREDVIKYALNLVGFRLLRFVSLYRLNEDEVPLFYGIDKMVDRELDRLYVQNDIGGAYILKGNK